MHFQSGGDGRLNVRSAPGIARLATLRSGSPSLNEHGELTPRSVGGSPRPPEDLRVAVMGKWNQKVKGLHLPNGVHATRAQYGAPPDLRNRTCPEEHFQTREEREVAAETLSFHRGPLTPASSAFRTRVFSERELAASEKAMRKLHRDNYDLEVVLSECNTLNAQGQLDAFANAVEAHFHHAGSPSAALRNMGASALVMKGAKVWHRPGTSTRGGNGTKLEAATPSSSASVLPELRPSQQQAPQRPVPILRFPSAMNGGATRGKTEESARKKSVVVTPVNVTPKGPADLKTLLMEQVAMEKQMETSAEKYQKMMTEFELSQENAHRMIDLFIQAQVIKEVGPTRDWGDEDLSVF